MTFYLIVRAMWELPEPNSRVVAATTSGISRNMQAPPPIEAANATPFAQGGGNLNGSANTAHLMGQAGTAGARVALPRRPMNSGNYCGVV